MHYLFIINSVSFHNHTRPCIDPFKHQLYSFGSNITSLQLLMFCSGNYSVVKHTHMNMYDTRWLHFVIKQIVKFQF
jgi:hypothetical protein